VASISPSSQLIGRASETMAGLLASVERVTLTVGEIATSSADQASGIRQVNDAIAQMDQVTQSNAALVEQAAAAADAVQARAMGLVASVQVFKLNSSLAEAV
jgi:methyl-accepting chemotaxis protein